jgi:hypothetical protein
MKSMAKGPGKRAHTPGSKTALPVGANVDIAAIRANITGVLNDQRPAASSNAAESRRANA